jgi:hypothetical protein
VLLGIEERLGMKCMTKKHKNAYGNTLETFAERVALGKAIRIQSP